MNGENAEVTQTFTYISSVIPPSTSCEQEVNRRLGRAWSAMNSLDGGQYLCKKTKVRVFRSLVLFLLYSCETWILTGELRGRLNSFGTMSLRRILGYRWHDYMSNDQVLREAGLRQVTCIVRERQLRLYGHVTVRLPAEDPAHLILSCRDSWGWTMPRVSPLLHGCVRWSPI